VTSSPAEAVPGFRARGARAHTSNQIWCRLVLALVAALLQGGCAWHKPVPPVPPPPAIPEPVPAAPEAGSVSGRVLLPTGPGAAGPHGPVVVYLAQWAGGPAAQRPGGPASAATRSLRIRPDAFAPRLTVVSASQRVRFRNQDQIYHRVFSASEAKPFDVGTLAEGASKSVRFERPGAVRFYCALHENESGLLFVSPSPWYAAVGADGAFEISDVPPGRYQLRTWSEGLRPVSRTVTVASGRSTAVEIAVQSADEGSDDTARESS